MIWYDLGDVAEWCERNPWDLLGYVLCAAVLIRFLCNNKKVHTAWSVFRIFYRLTVDTWSFYGKRMLRRLKPKKVEQFSGDPNQPVMRRPAMRAPIRRAIPPPDMEALLQSLAMPVVVKPDANEGNDEVPARLQMTGAKSCETCEDCSQQHSKTE